jgi:hypothetical protein
MMRRMRILLPTYLSTGFGALTDIGFSPGLAILFMAITRFKKSTYNYADCTGQVKLWRPASEVVISAASNWKFLGASLLQLGRELQMRTADRLYRQKCNYYKSLSRHSRYICHTNIP